jgi:Fasciclin domain
MPTIIKPLQVKVHVVKNGERGTLILNDAVHVVQSDIVVQDGVIHRVDDILLPPKLETEAQGPYHSTSAWEKIWLKLFQTDQMTVEELMERFQPYIDRIQDDG